MVKAKHPKGTLTWKPCIRITGCSYREWKICQCCSTLPLEKEFERYGLSITRQNIVNWMIRLADEYLSVMYDYMHRLLYKYHVIQADETPVLVDWDGRSAGSKSWMWVCRSGFMYADKQILLVEYEKTRNASHPRIFLKDYSCIGVIDRYQVYHIVEKELEELTITGCWVRGRRRLDEALNLIPKPARSESMVYLIMKQIQAIYREPYATPSGNKTIGGCFVCVPQKSFQ